MTVAKKIGISLGKFFMNFLMKIGKTVLILGICFYIFKEFMFQYFIDNQFKDEYFYAEMKVENFIVRTPFIKLEQCEKHLEESKIKGNCITGKELNKKKLPIKMDSQKG